MSDMQPECPQHLHLPLVSGDRECLLSAGMRLQCGQLSDGGGQGELKSESSGLIRDKKNQGNNLVSIKDDPVTGTH